MAPASGSAHKSRLQAEVEAELRIPMADEKRTPDTTTVELGEATYTKMLSRRD